jgi:hypothetical protein
VKVVSLKHGFLIKGVFWIVGRKEISKLQNLKISVHVNVIDGWRLEELEPVLLQQVVQLFRTSFEDLAKVIDLDNEYPNVNLVPRYGPEHLEFGPFDIQAVLTKQNKISFKNLSGSKWGLQM